MKTMLKFASLSAMALLLFSAQAYGETKLTVGVGHMCCGKCVASATESVSKVATAVTIDGKNVTMTVKGDDVLPALEALRKGGFPATKLDVGSGPVTIAVGHMCCGHCVTDLKAALTKSDLADLDADTVDVGMGRVVVKAKAGMTLDLVPLLALMDKTGFSATKVTLGTAAAVKPHTHPTTRVASAVTTHKR